MADITALCLLVEFRPNFLHQNIEFSKAFWVRPLDRQIIFTNTTTLARICTSSRHTRKNSKITSFISHRYYQDIRKFRANAQPNCKFNTVPLNCNLCLQMPRTFGSSELPDRRVNGEGNVQRSTSW